MGRMYVLRRSDDGKYVAPAGRKHSYTKKLTEARIYKTRESAAEDACGNEDVVPVNMLVEGVRR